MPGGWTYIMTNHSLGVLYIGVTANLVHRVALHRAGQGSVLCRRYKLTRLVLAEWHDAIDDAIVREKLLKTWKHAWKIDLIGASNPQWRDLWDHIAMEGQ
jgi:putative endonuclease